MVVNQVPDQRGIFWDGHLSYPWVVLGFNIFGALAIMAWSCFWSIVLFGTLSYFKILRVSPEDEAKGMDLVKHGEAAYPANVSLLIKGINRLLL